MKVIDLERDGRIQLDKFGNADFLTGIEAEKQIINNTILQFKGSWFDNLDDGIDWLNILGKRYNINTIKSEVATVLFSLDFVEKIITMNLGSVDNSRKTELTFVLTTTSQNVIEFQEVL